MTKTTAPKTPKTPKTIKTPRAPRVSKKHAAATAQAALDALREQEAIAAVHMPSQEQLDAEEAACKAEEAANLAAEAAELAEAQPPVDGYTGPMLRLRERLAAGAYSKAANGNPCCGDEIATILGQCTPQMVIRACITAMALPGNPYAHLNVGQQSMNLRNKLRGCMKRGEFGIGVLREAVEDEQARVAAHLAGGALDPANFVTAAE